MYRLNPFFVRAHVRTLSTNEASALNGLVSIPSSSGRTFGHGICLSKPPAMPSLNPFFVRAHVRTDYVLQYAHRFYSLNPFFVRAHVRTTYGMRLSATEDGSQSLLRQGARSDHAGQVKVERAAGLNPFFVRAHVRTTQRVRSVADYTESQSLLRQGARSDTETKRVRSGGEVSIPSSSGRTFGQSLAWEGFKAELSQSLLRQGARSDPSSDGKERADLLSLNPFFVRAHVRTRLR